MNSFIPWIGGKSRLRKYIIPLIPADAGRYIEVFGGAAWVLFGKEQTKGQMEVYNDIDGNLVNLYLQIKNNCVALQNELDALHSRELFRRYKTDIVEGTELTDLQRAARYWYLIKCSFGANRYSFATSPRDLSKSVDELYHYRDRLRRVIIENLDFEQLIKTYDRPQACFYLDPPYVDTERYYKSPLNSFKTADHKRLKDVLRSIKGRFILSYNDCDFIRDIYANYNITSVSRLNQLPGKPSTYSDFREVIITNF